MLRRTFLSTAGVAAFVPAAGAHEEPEEIGSFTAHACNVADCGNQHLLPLPPGAGLALRRTPGRRYDPTSIGVYYEDALLGYLSRHTGAVIGAMIDAGVEVRAAALESSAGARPKLALTASIYRA